MAATLHVDDLLKFLETAGSKGWIKQNTASSLKTTCERVLGELDVEELVDVAKIDVDDAINRFANKNGDIGSGSLATYKSRIRSAIKMFTDAKANPTGWKPPTSRAVRVAVNGKAGTPKAGGREINSDNRENQNAPRTESTEEVADAIGRGLSYPFPLRANMTITISNIPRDLRATEVDRIAQFLKALAIGDHTS
ncbi:MAG: hypothetical protein LW822_08505 [Phycisphaeraceae bacterium]|jgi:hypothetical protein|nr:hypothetical protein [Phycisphaeraceae bacterium]